MEEGKAGGATRQWREESRGGEEEEDTEEEGDCGCEVGRGGRGKEGEESQGGGGGVKHGVHYE